MQMSVYLLMADYCGMHHVILPQAFEEDAHS